jgi:radical SAM protein with 4Fe4S-binding SPASM domain
VVIDILDRVFQKTPLVQAIYMKRAAKLKRTYCLLLHRFGILKPYTFVQWLATYKCNFHCPYCEASAGNPADNELSTEEAKQFIDDLAGMKIKRLAVSGGEPLVRHDILELLAYANAKNISLGLVTNGYRVKTMWNRLRRLRYFLYFTSIDGTEAYNDQVRGKKGAFKHALRGLELFGSLGVKTRMINTVVTPQNMEMLDEMLQVFRESAATRWVLTPTASVGRAAHDSRYSLDDNQVRNLIDFIARNQTVMNVDLGESHTYLKQFYGKFFGKPFFCGAGLTRCAVMPDGEVLGCQQAYDNALSEGNIRDVPFSRIWKERFTSFRQSGFPAYCSDCEFLDACQGGCWAEMQVQKSCLKDLCR